MTQRESIRRATGPMVELPVLPKVACDPEAISKFVPDVVVHSAEQVMDRIPFSGSHARYLSVDASPSKMRDSRRRMPMCFYVFFCTGSFLTSAFLVVINALLIAVGHRHANSQCNRYLPMWLQVQGVLGLGSLFSYALQRIQRRQTRLLQFFLAIRSTSFAWLILGTVWTFAISPEQCNAKVFDWAYTYICVCWGLALLQLLLLAYTRASNLLKNLRKVWQDEKRSSEMKRLKESSSDSQTQDNSLLSIVPAQ